MWNQEGKSTAGEVNGIGVLFVILLYHVGVTPEARSELTLVD
jgi:hypothetical protein